MKGRLDGLHSLRAWAALSIVIFHTFGIANLPLPSELRFVQNYLGLGVPLFFVISSFSLFLSTAPRVGSTDWLGAYLIRRVFRIAPLFYTMVAFYLVFIPWKYQAWLSWSDVALNLSFLFNLVPPKHESVVWAGWTIGVEMLFYLLVPYLLLFVRNGLHATVVLGVSVLTSYYFFGVYETASYPQGYAYKSLLGSLGIFAFGIPAYFAFLRASRLDQKARARMSVGLLVLAFLALTVAVRYEQQWVPLVRNRSHIWGVVFALFVVSQSLKPTPGVSGKTLAWLGNLSFGLYLCHPPLISTLKPVYEVFYRLPVWQGWSFLFSVTLTLALLIPIAYLAGRFIEQPFIKLGEKLIQARHRELLEIAIERSTKTEGHEHLMRCSSGRIGALEQSVSKRVALAWHYIANPWIFVAKARRALHILSTSGIRGLYERLRRSSTPEYATWLAQFDTLTEEKRTLLRQESEGFEYRPLISILLPVKDPPIPFLQQSIDSVRHQLYDNWELCIADDNSSDPRVRTLVQEYAAQDDRIRFTFRDEKGHISKATNSAASIARGEWFGLLDHDDILREHALTLVVRELNDHPSAELLFSDEDKISESGTRHYPHFKPSWNPELILAYNYVCHFLVVRSSLFRQLHGMRSCCDGAQDWDFVLRASEVTSPAKIRHIPHILYHWRVHTRSTATEAGVKPYIAQAQIKAVSEHLQRTGIEKFKVEQLPGMHALRVRYPVPVHPPLVSLIIPTRNQLSLLRECIDGLRERTYYRNIEILIIDNGSDDEETLKWLRLIPLRDSRIRVIRDDSPFNYSRLNNMAARHARGTLLGFINNDIKVVHPEWLDEMVSHVVRSTIAAVGARLLYPNGTVQHAGVITGIGGVAGHQFKGCPAGSFGYFYRARLPQDLSAVTAACMVVRKDVFEDVGGFNEEELAVAFNDVDLCLKIRAAGYRILYTPYAELLHRESASRGYENNPEKQRRFEQEVRTMKKRWADVLERDPFYNPNLSLEVENFGLSLSGPRLAVHGPNGPSHKQPDVVDRLGRLQ